MSEAQQLKEFRFSIALMNRHLASVTVPVPISRENLERLLRIMKDQLEPFVLEEDEGLPAAELPSSSG